VLVVEDVELLLLVGVVVVDDVDEVVGPSVVGGTLVVGAGSTTSSCSPTRRCTPRSRPHPAHR